MKDVCVGFPPKCPICGRPVRTYPKHGKHKERFRKEWLRMLEEARKDGELVDSCSSPVKKLYPAKPRKCPRCGSVSKKFFQTPEGWVRYCSACGLKH